MHTLLELMQVWCYEQGGLEWFGYPLLRRSSRSSISPITSLSMPPEIGQLTDPLELSVRNPIVPESRAGSRSLG